MDTATLGKLNPRDRAVLVTACASAFGDSYCALAWGGKLAARAGPDTAAAVVTGQDSGLTDAERAMARWARAVARDPNATRAAVTFARPPDAAAVLPTPPARSGK